MIGLIGPLGWHHDFFNLHIGKYKLNIDPFGIPDHDPFGFVSDKGEYQMGGFRSHVNLVGTITI